jgi:hypothetical protein
MFNTEITIPEKLYQFAREYVEDHYCLKLLQFFGAHPYAKFSKLAIVHALNASGERLYIEKALNYLTDRGAIIASASNSSVLYSLSNDEPLRKLALALSKLGCYQWQIILSKPAGIKHDAMSIADAHQVVVA